MTEKRNMIIESSKNKKRLQEILQTLFLFLAERQGFEPRVPFSTTVFKTAALNRSAISPKHFISKAVQS